MKSWEKGQDPRKRKQLIEVLRSDEVTCSQNFSTKNTGVVLLSLFLLKEEDLWGKMGKPSYSKPVVPLSEPQGLLLYH